MVWGGQLIGIYDHIWLSHGASGYVLGVVIKMNFVTQCVQQLLDVFFHASVLRRCLVPTEDRANAELNTGGRKNCAMSLEHERGVTTAGVVVYMKPT